MKPCKCGCGQIVNYAYAPGHRPQAECPRCGKTFSPLSGQGPMCSTCRRKVKNGGPLERNGSLITSREMQKAAPEGRRWCSGCNRYRLLKFFGKDASHYYSRCKPCFRKQNQASTIARKYSLSLETYEAIKGLQGGHCAICQFATGASKALAVDHDHTCCPSGQSCGKCIRGLLCSTCNQMLGFSRDDPALFERAISYLADPPAQRMNVERST